MTDNGPSGLNDTNVEGTLRINSNPNRNKYRSPREEIMDHMWIKNTFILGDNKEDIYNEWLKKNRFFSSADIKSGGTGPGMNIALNPLPQITRYADIRRPGTIAERDSVPPMRTTGVPAYRVNTPPSDFGWGFGRYYSEAIDDNQQRIFIRFGEPQFTSMLLWLGRSFDIHKAILFKRGVISRVLISVIAVATTVFAVAAAPWLFAAVYVLNMVLQPGRFISVKDNMYTYWTMTETLLNKIYVKRTNVPFMFDFGKSGADTSIGKQPSINENYIRSLNEIIPGIVDPTTGRISVWAIALRGQSAFNRSVAENLDKEPDFETVDPSNFTLDDETDDGLYDHSNREAIAPGRFTKWFLEKAYSLIAQDAEENTPDWAEDIVGGIDRAMRKIPGVSEALAETGEEDDINYKVPINETASLPDGSPLQINIDSKELADSPENIMAINNQAKERTYSRYGEYLTAMLTGGAAFLVLNVDSTGSVGESFSNSSETNPIETLFNSISSKIRALMNTVSSAFEIPIIGDGIKLIADAGLAMVSSATAGLANPLIALAYSTTISLPKSWGQSSASLPRASYKIKLTSPYGNAYSQLFNMYLPLAAIMCGSLPRATGSDSHTAPFMLQLFDRGRVNIPYGMVESLSITRGTSNLAFTRSGQPNAIDVDLNIVDLNQMITLDVDASGLATRAMNQFSPNFGDSAIDVYVDTLVGQDVYHMFYKMPKLRLKLAERAMILKSTFTDPAAHAAFTVRHVPLLSTFSELMGGSVAVESSKH